MRLSANEITKDAIRAFIACALGESHIIHKAHRIITAEMIPDTMIIEKKILDAIEKSRSMGGNPEIKIIKGILSVNGNTDKLLEDFDKWVEKYFENGSQEREKNLKLYARMIDVWYTEQAGNNALAEAVKIMESEDFGDYQERYNYALDVMSKNAPRSDSMIVSTNLALFHDFSERMFELHTNKQAGLDLGPTMPYRVTQNQIGYFEWGEITTLMSNTGGGKTTMMLDIAEHVAWVQQLSPKVDVVIFSLETVLERLMMRQFARNSWIPYGMLKTGQVNPKDDKNLPIFRDIENKLVKAAAESGEIRFVFIPDANINSLTDEMTRQRDLSDTRGRRCLFFFDYIQKAPFWDFQRSEAGVIQMYTEKIASKNRTIGTHSIIIAQYNDSTGEAFGAGWVRKASQLGFLLRREMPEGGCAEDLPVLVSKGVQAKDRYGNPRWFHRKGDKISSIATLETIKANDSAQLSTILHFESEFYRIHEDKNQVSSLKSQGLIK